MDDSKVKSVVDDPEAKNTGPVIIREGRGMAVDGTDAPFVVRNALVKVKDT